MCVWVNVVWVYGCVYRCVCVCGCVCVRECVTEGERSRENCILVYDKTELEHKPVIVVDVVVVVDS